MVTSSEDGTVKVWDTRTGSLQRNYVHRAAVNDVVIHPNQGELISGDHAGMEDTAVLSVSVASDGSLLCAGNKKGNVYLWRMVQTDETTRIIPVCTFQAHKDYLTRVLLSPDVKHLATCSADHTAKVWNLDTEFPPAKLALKQWKEKEALNPPVETPAEAPVASVEVPAQSRDLLRIFDAPIQDRDLLRITDNPRQETPQQTFLIPTGLLWIHQPHTVPENHPGQSPALGLGLRLLCRQCIPCHCFERSLCSPMGTRHWKYHPPVQRPS
ncbi:hypothetical protein PDIDSM_1099 [Penicillium digitatum]|nr:hypothetical protein PDIDSM_2697 [Penicillium digitatum]KAG0155522.1 hypothetical protein PDIDSM_1099 [Penicillium digitatum]